MDSGFGFLSADQRRLLTEILTRRNPALLARIEGAHSVSRSDAEEITTILSEEFINNLDDDWEPTDYGGTVSAVMAQFNDARISEWP